MIGVWVLNNKQARLLCTVNYVGIASSSIDPANMKKGGRYETDELFQLMS